MYEIFKIVKYNGNGNFCIGWSQNLSKDKDKDSLKAIQNFTQMEAFLSTVCLYVK